LSLQKVAKLLDGKASVANDAAEREGVDRVMSWDGEDAHAVRHDDVLTLTDNGKPGLLESTHSIEVIDTRDFGQD
jgi:hypothetical protein